MGFFKQFFSTPQPKEPTPAIAFDQAWYQAVAYFETLIRVPDFNFKLKHPKTGQEMTPHEGIGKTFDDWLAIDARSPWDRHALLLDVLFQTVSKSLNVWQIANIFVALRYPQNALQILEEHPIPAGDPLYPRYCEATARALLYLQRPADALSWAQKAYDSDPQDRFYRVRLADSLHLLGRHEEAHNIYGAMLNNHPKPDMTKPTSAESTFVEMFSLNKGVVPSPVMAINIIESITDPETQAEFWRLGELEFYDSGFFRMHHAYHMLKQNQPLRALAKLTSLVGEMPWLHEATINLHQLLKKLDPTGEKLMPELQQKLTKTIQDNGWTTDNMQVMNVQFNLSLNNEKPLT